ncbi:phage tail assembly protein [Clostridium botulinum]|uniref:phage tail assembly protein n=1 Tax=Clostridium botulinum TaxID=1491 RepID=UPI00196728DB|nr:phage tail assembly protein [Clostridium botulinum]MBN1048708.1 phage tail assembly protein [Clostridium botulinum]
MEEKELIVQSVGELMLKKTVLIDGNEVKKINYDFDELTGEDIETVFKDAIRSGYMVSSSYELDPVIGGRMFAQAAGLDFNDIKRLKLKDYTEAAGIARAFFITDLDGDQEDQN